MKTLKIKLKQHTPLIHFQHDQEGATLRASEVKPKLDRFILSRLTMEEKAQGRNEGWIKSKNDRVWLDYKMRIEAHDISISNINERKEYDRRHERKGKPFIIDNKIKYLAKERKSDRKIIFDLETYPLFFANLDADYMNSEEYRKFSFTEEPLNLELIVQSDSLFRYISNPTMLNDFFFQTNFGTRQSKGFGSFSLDKSDPKYQARSSKYRFIIDSGGWDDVNYIEDEFKKMFEYIDLFYKTLRGGINLKNGRGETLFYFKSLAKEYADKSLNAKWDKRKIKEEFYRIERQHKPHTYDIRDMMGFSTNEQWMSYHDSIEKKSTVWDDKEKRLREPRASEKPLAERMSSPILIKPFFDEVKCIYTINIIFQDKKVNMAGFKECRKVYISSKKNHRSFGIDIPQEFSSESFFDYIFNVSNFDISIYVDKEFQGHEYYGILKDIYKQLKDNIS